MLNRSRFSEKGDGEGFTDKVDNVYNSSTYAYAMHTSKTGKLITALKKEAMLEAQNTFVSDNHFHLEIIDAPKKWSIWSTSRYDQHCRSGCPDPDYRLFH